ncbi:MULTISPECIES: endolytic transglycosylase MltG [Rhodomicrobium]|uniref:endolytic transglycosylase MltG n=1 Tax=Rhodomicrobium TaxID=1068 RepID=UPI000B4AF245|nr:MULTISPECIES: endolytic transglycosylase MltG [Rhodomicrobium]
MPGDNRQWEQDRGYQGGGYYGAHRDYGALPRSPAEALEPDHAPEPPVDPASWRQRPIVRILNNVITLAFVGVIGLAILFYFVRTQFDQPGPLEFSTVVVIPKGEGVREIASRLEREGVISDQRIFVAAVLVYFQAQSRLKAGEYAIKKQASMRNVLDALVEGKTFLHSVSLPEGLTSYQVVERLNAHPELTGKINLIPAEGSLLPDTYRFARGTDREELIARMQSEQRKFMDKIWPKRATGLPIKTREEAVTLASIVEKETGRADERPRVAAVFVNRLQKNMRLQSDPTIIYGLSGGKGTLGRPILRTEIEQMTPYNTYTIKGLPPTPIANPGRAALEAVLRPAKTSDLYFVADGTGGHTFSETYDDHKKGVTQWRIIEKEIRAKQEAAAKAAAAQQTAAANPPGGTATDAGSPVVPGIAITAVSTEPGGGDDDGTVPIPVRKPKL